MAEARRIDEEVNRVTREHSLASKLKRRSPPGWNGTVCVGIVRG